MKPLIVGIAGGTASGKTTTAKAMLDRLDDSLLITHDQYYKTMPDEHRDDPTAYNFDHPVSLDTERLVSDLQALQAGEPAELPTYDFANHRRSDPVRVEPAPVILVEGILVLAHPGLRDVMRHRVYVHAPDDIRLIRRIRRDVEARGRSIGQILAQWERTVRPMHHRYVAPSREYADLVVDGTTTTEAMVAAVLGLIG